MLAIQYIRNHPEEVQRAADQKGIGISIEALLASDEVRRKLVSEAEILRKSRNELSTQVHTLIKQGKKTESAAMSRQVRELADRLRLIEEELADADKAFQQLMQRVPNIVSPDTPVGASDKDNVECRCVGGLPEFSFEPRDHVALGGLHDILDIPRGVKTSGTRHYYLKGFGLHLHRAVQQLAVDLLVRKGFTLMDVPMLVRERAMTDAGFFPLGREQVFELADGQHFLAGTSEIPLISYYQGEIVDVAEPIRLAAVSTCFRSEVGSAGRDVHGLYRVHQFAKVEQVILCRSDAQLAEALLQEITANAEELLQLLELPYRVVAVCTGDMSQKTYKQYDIETWMPSRHTYGETHSSSNLLDFQARRASIRYRQKDGSTAFCYTLNNTMAASPRLLIPLLEIHQREDGSIRIPQALQPYMYGLTQLELPKHGLDK